MCTQCKLILVYGIIVLFLSNTRGTEVNVTTVRFAGTVENITVYALEDESYLENRDAYKVKSLKLNISWIPPNEGKQPSSYSIMITNIPKKTDVHRTECTEGSAFYNVQNKSLFSLLVPQNRLSNDMPELLIRPNCTYTIQVYANPRAKPENSSEVTYTVPECVGRKCSCASAKTALPVPTVEASQTKGNIIINWNVTSNDSDIHSYIISIGVLLLTSKAGHPVYNITKITNVTSTTHTFMWNLKINEQYIKMKDGYKILVAAMDHRGCLGTQGSFTVVIPGEVEASRIGNTMWLLLVGVAACIVISFTIASMYNKNRYEFIWSSRSLRRQTIPQISPCKAQWSELTSQNSDLLYIEQRAKDACCKVPDESDKFEIPYKCINLMYKLGEGQFGIVYLGRLRLNNDKNKLVAIKMSQCSDMSNEPRARCQLLEEIKIMKAAGSHLHLVSLIGCCTSPNNPICILLEYMEGGDLLAYLHSRRRIESTDTTLCTFERAASRYVNVIEMDRNMEENIYGAIEKEQFIKFAVDIAKGMEHLEAKRITHRDLAARNILLTSNLTLKISDFGLSRNGIYVINNTTSKVRQLPIRWMSPEAIRDYAFSSKSDVWSFGIVLWEIETLGSFPYANIQDDKLMRYLIQDKCRLTCPNTISHDVYKIMCSCWNTAPQDRPSFTQLVLDLQTLKEPLHSTYETSNPCYTLL